MHKLSLNHFNRSELQFHGGLRQLIEHVPEDASLLQVQVQDRIWFCSAQSKAPGRPNDPKVHDTPEGERIMESFHHGNAWAKSLIALAWSPALHACPTTPQANALLQKREDAGHHQKTQSFAVTTRIYRAELPYLILRLRSSGGCTSWVGKEGWVITYIVTHSGRKHARLLVVLKVLACKWYDLVLDLMQNEVCMA